MRIVYKDCKFCKGTGELLGNKCKVCKGHGQIAVKVSDEGEDQCSSGLETE